MGKLVLHLIPTLINTIWLYLDYVREFKVCKNSLWKWREAENGGTLSVKFRTKNKVNTYMCCVR